MDTRHMYKENDVVYPPIIQLGLASLRLAHSISNVRFHHILCKEMVGSRVISMIFKKLIQKLVLKLIHIQHSAIRWQWNRIGVMEPVSY